MNELDDRRTPEEARARDAVRALSRPVTREEFRARLRRAFIAGTPESAAPAIVLRLPWHRRATTRWAAAAFAAAAAFVIAFVANRAPEWKLESVHGDGVVVVDGAPVPTAHVEDLARRMKPGAFVQLPAEVQLELVSHGTLAVQITAGTHASVPSLPGRWFARRAVAEVREGEIRVTTGSAFHGARLAIETPEARVAVVGTTFAVICEPAGTCVCVMEGRLMVGSRGGSMSPVMAGHRRYVFADGRPEESADMRASEHEPLGDLLERMKSEMGRGR
jgi:ferric-dicitrate binding protein FerR (iron transport regulator)